MDATRPNVIAFVDRLLQRVVDLANGTLDNGAPRAFAGYVSLRYTSGSFPFLAMQRFTATVAFEVAGLGRVHGTEPFLRAIEADAVQLGGAMHWGQRNNFSLYTRICNGPSQNAGAGSCSSLRSDPRRGEEAL